MHLQFILQEWSTKFTASLKTTLTQLTFNCSKSTIETLGKDVK